MPLFSPHWWWERGINQFFKYFWKILPRFEEKVFEIHKQSWLWINWIHKKLGSIQNLVEDIPKIKLIHWSLMSKTYTFNNSTSSLIALSWTNFVFYPNNHLVPIQILSYREWTVAAFNYFHFFHTLDLDYRFYFEIYTAE